MHSKQRLSLALGILGATFVFGNSPVIAASLSFTPAGTNGVIAKNIGQGITFTIAIDVSNLNNSAGNPIGPIIGTTLDVELDIIWNFNELQQENPISLNDLSLLKSPTTVSNITGTNTKKMTIFYEGLGIGQELQLGKNNNLGKLNYTVKNNQDNGVQDFSINLTKSIARYPQGGFDVVALPGNRNAQIVKPLPEPLTLLGSGLALGLGILFKKKRNKRHIS